MQDVVGILPRLSRAAQFHPHVALATAAVPHHPKHMVFDAGYVGTVRHAPAP